MDVRETKNFACNSTRLFWEISRLFFIKKLIKQYCHSAEHIVDIGCGDCFILQAIGEYMPHCKLSGIDNTLTAEHIDLIKNVLQTISIYHFIQTSLKLRLLMSYCSMMFLNISKMSNRFLMKYINC